MTKPKILILGFARHGKDTVADIFTDHGYKCSSSSQYACKPVMMPYFERQGKPYTSPEACFEDRSNHRKAWYDEIEAYNAPSWNRLSRELLGSGFDIYVGMRSKTEFDASKHLYDIVIWVDASNRHPPEDKSSCSVSPSDAHLILDNNGNLDDLKFVVAKTIFHLTKSERLPDAPTIIDYVQKINSGECHQLLIHNTWCGPDLTTVILRDLNRKWLEMARADSQTERGHTWCTIPYDYSPFHFPNPES